MIAVSLATIFLFIADRVVKYYSLRGVFDEPIKMIGSIARLFFTKNYNIAFSIPLAGWWLNLVIIAIIFGLFYYLFYSDVVKKNLWQSASLYSIIAGAISNLLDRLKYGYVVDYIDVKYFTVFNIADMMIVGGVFVLAINIFRKRERIK